MGRLEAYEEVIERRVHTESPRASVSPTAGAGIGFGSPTAAAAAESPMPPTTSPMPLMGVVRSDLTRSISEQKDDKKQQQPQPQPADDADQKERKGGPQQQQQQQPRIVGGVIRRPSRGVEDIDASADAQREGLDEKKHDDDDDHHEQSWYSPLILGLRGVIASGIDVQLSFSTPTCSRDPDERRRVWEKARRELGEISFWGLVWRWLVSNTEGIAYFMLMLVLAKSANVLSLPPALVALGGTPLLARGHASPLLGARVVSGVVVVRGQARVARRL